MWYEILFGDVMLGMWNGISRGDIPVNSEPNLNDIVFQIDWEFS